MLCPYCFSDSNTTYNTRPSSEYIYRERKCKACGKHWLTVEVDLDRIPEEYREGDGYENNSMELNRMIRLKKPKKEDV